jgi:intracellular multiplication protein IcmJ
LQPLNFSIDAPAAHPAPALAMVAATTAQLCNFCGLSAGFHAMRIGKSISCVLCGLVQSLHRTTIDEELRLIWLPEMSQPALNVLVRQIHIDLQELGESVFCDDTPKTPEGMRPTLYTAQRIMRERSETISERLGSSRASDLSDALTVLADRHSGLHNLPWGGLRALPTGRFYVAGVNVYDEILGSWRRLNRTPMKEIA